MSKTGNAHRRHAGEPLGVEGAVAAEAQVHAVREARV